MTPAIESKDRSPAPLIRSGGMTLVDVQPAEPADPDVRIEIRCPSCDRSVIVRIADLIRALGDESTFTCPLGHALYPLPDSIRDQIRQMQNDLSDRTSQVDHMFIEMTRIQIEIAKLRPAINYLNDPQLLISRDDTAEQLDVIARAAARIGSICDWRLDPENWRNGWTVPELAPGSQLQADEIGSHWVLRLLLVLGDISSYAMSLEINQHDPDKTREIASNIFTRVADLTRELESSRPITRPLAARSPGKLPA